MTSVLMFGLEGSGKTVLTATLAKRFGVRQQNQVFWEPLTGATNQFVERVWQTLAEGEWPPSTPQGELEGLHWQLHWPSMPPSTMSVVDVAGQDLRQLFGEERVTEYDRLPGHLRQLTQLVDTADVVLLLLNLGDFCGVSDANRRRQNEWALKFMLDYLRRRESNPPTIALLLTQCDLYVGIWQKFSEDWAKVVEHYVPMVTATYLTNATIYIVPISAVCHTRIDVADPGGSRRVPAVPLRSQGLERLMTWMEEAIRHQSAQRRVAESTPSSVSAGIEDGWTQAWTFAKWFLVSFFLFFVGTRIFQGRTKEELPVPPLAPKSPVATVVRSQYVPTPGVFDDQLTSQVLVRNDGIGGNVRVTSWVIEDGIERDRKSADRFLNAGEESWFQIVLPGVQNLRHDVKVYSEATVP